MKTPGEIVHMYNHEKSSRRRHADSRSCVWPRPAWRSDEMGVLLTCYLECCKISSGFDRGPSHCFYHVLICTTEVRIETAFSSVSGHRICIEVASPFPLYDFRVRTVLGKTLVSYIQRQAAWLCCFLTTRIGKRRPCFR